MAAVGSTADGISATTAETAQRINVRFLEQVRRGECRLELNNARTCFCGRGCCGLTFSLSLFSHSFSFQVKDYARMMSAVQGAIAQRREAQLAFWDAQEDLSKKEQVRAM